MSDTNPPTTVSSAAQPVPSKRWVELPTGETLQLKTIREGRVEGYRTLKTGKRVKFTGDLEDWLRVVARYGGL